MNIIQCTFCKKPFASLRDKVCPECHEKMDQNFVVVRDYLYEHERAGIDEIAEETEVPKQHIMYLIKEGRLIINSPDGKGGGLLSCEVCKKPINTGRMCKECMASLAGKMDRSVSADKKPATGKIAEQNFKGTAKIGN